jgi:hypothetical protein
MTFVLMWHAVFWCYVVKRVAVLFLILSLPGYDFNCIKFDYASGVVICFFCRIFSVSSKK